MPAESIKEDFRTDIIGGDGQLRLEVAHLGTGHSPWFGDNGKLSRVTEAVLRAVRGLDGVTRAREGLTTSHTLRVCVDVTRGVSIEEFKAALIRAVLDVVHG